MLPREERGAHSGELFNEQFDARVKRTRASVLTLALLMAWVLADNHNPAVAANDLAVVADLLNAWLYLHVGSLYSLSSYPRDAVSRYFSAIELLVTVGDATTCEIVGRELYENTIFGKNANVVLTHFS